ncbi:MAG: phosphodiester glycosidase family protein [Cyanobacteria bacterium P01_D01_bin.105]
MAKTIGRLFIRWAAGAGIGLLAAVAMLSLVYGSYVLRRPPRTPEGRSLFKGVDYQRTVFDTPRPLSFHVVTIDLTAPGIRFLASPSGTAADGKETTANTVPGFLEAHDLQLAINANFFYPMHVMHPLDYSPHVGEGVNVVGIAISQGEQYSAAEEGWAALCILNNQDIRMTEGDCPVETQQAVAGDIQFVKDGELHGEGLSLIKNNDAKRFPRTAIALNADHTTLWIVLVDGRQKCYSEGITLSELGGFLIELGADKALNLDGGGSSAIAADIDGKATLLNAPIQARVPMYLRPVANHLGLYAEPLDSVQAESP